MRAMFAPQIKPSNDTVGLTVFSLHIELSPVELSTPYKPIDLTDYSLLPDGLVFL